MSPNRRSCRGGGPGGGPVLEDGHAEGLPGVARLDAAVPHGGAAAAHGHRAGGGRARPRGPGTSHPSGSSHLADGVRSTSKGCEVGLGLPAGVVVVRAPAPGLGPLQGIAAGLAAVRAAGGGAAGGAFVCATDMPFLHPASVRAVPAALTGDVALPFARGHRQPLSAAYRVGPAPAGCRAARRGRPDARRAVRPQPGHGPRRRRAARRPRRRAPHPEIDSLTNVNTPAEYAAARARPPAAVVVEDAGCRHTVGAPRSPRRWPRWVAAQARRSS